MDLHTIFLMSFLYNIKPKWYANQIKHDIS